MSYKGILEFERNIDEKNSQQVGEYERKYWVGQKVQPNVYQNNAFTNQADNLTFQ